MTTLTASLITAPERSIQQRMEALQRANDVRSRRAEFKQQMKAEGRAIRYGTARVNPLGEIVELLQDPPDWLQTMKIFDLLIALPKCGRVKANKVLTRCRISPSKTVGGLSDRQRRELVSLVRRRA